MYARQRAQISPRNKNAKQNKISKLQNEPVSKQNIASIEPPTVSIKKHKFTGSNPNTATANFLQFMKFEKGMCVCF